MKKRILSMLLALIMALSLVPVTAFAAATLEGYFEGLPVIAETEPGTPGSTNKWKVTTLDGEDVLISGNAGKSSSSSMLQLTFTSDVHMTFEYKVSSEARYDKCTITLGSTTLVNGESGDQSWKPLEIDAKSGFALLGEGYTLIFDYFEDSVSADKGIVHEQLLSREGRLYVFSSHAHADHFNRQILSWKALRPDIVYLLSTDIPLSDKDKENGNLHTLAKGDTYRDEYLTVRAFGSTDIGISFLVQTPEGATVFHAGDLNNWHWMDESPEEEWKRDEAFFLRELEDIAVCKEKMDIVLFPVDPRLGKEYMRGPLQFVKRIKTTIFVPMHFDEAFEKASAFALLAASEGTQVLTPVRRGETLNLDHYINLK